MGFISGILFVALLGMSAGKKPQEKSKPWKKIMSYNFSTDFDIKWDKEIEGSFVGHAIAEAMATKSEDVKFKVSPGEYTVRVLVRSTFIKRGDSEGDT